MNRKLEPRPSDAPDRIYRPLSEIDRDEPPAKTSVTVLQVRAALRRYRLILRGQRQP